MSTYVLMRLLESAPSRYDRGIRMLTFGRVDPAYDWLVERVGAGHRVLDIGCGTGALSLRAARRGGLVKGIDRSAEMLALARRRVAEEHLDDRVELVEEGVAELDGEPDAAFDVVMSGLCFSELSSDELAYTIRQVKRLLKPGGLLLVADEVLPEGPVARLADRAARLPMAVVTFALTQQTTRPLRGLTERLGEAGLGVIDERRTALGSLGCFVARSRAEPVAGGRPVVSRPVVSRPVAGGRPVVSRLRRPCMVAVQTLLRMLPFPTRTGLVRIGSPGADSPVLLTGNFGLTVDRARQGIDGLDAYLLVANSRGVNVWCAATGGLFTDHDVISVIKTSGIDHLVRHREVILPQLAATGIDGKRVRQRTGWRVVWGPVDAKDIPRFLSGGRQSTPAMRTVAFGGTRRAEMAVAWAFPVSVVALVLLAFWPDGVLPLIGFVWASSFGLFLAFPLYEPLLHPRDENEHRGLAVPGVGPRSLPIVIWAALGALASGVTTATGTFSWAQAWRWGLASLVVLEVLGVDLTGSTPVYKSGLHEDRLLGIGLDEQRCRAAGFCEQVCPKNVFEIDHGRRLAVLARPDECVQCGACIVQCPFDALHFDRPGGGIVEPAVVRRYKLNLLGSRRGPD